MGAGQSGLPNGDIPFCYRRHNKDDPADKEGHIYIVPEEAEALIKVFRYYAGGNWSLAQLATLLNEQGFRTRNKHKLTNGTDKLITGPQPFSLYSIRGLLHNPFFTGKVSYHGQIYDGQHEPLIDEALFNQVQQKLRQVKNRSRSVSTAFRLYLLKGIIRCIYCGYPLWCETSTKGYAL